MRAHTDSLLLDCRKLRWLSHMSLPAIALGSYTFQPVMGLRLRLPFYSEEPGLTCSRRGQLCCLRAFSIFRMPKAKQKRCQSQLRAQQAIFSPNRALVACRVLYGGWHTLSPFFLLILCCR